MTAIEWDKLGDRFYEYGIDHGVLYLDTGTAVPWNGLISVSDDSKLEIKPYYQEGQLRLANPIPGDFEGKIKAFTYPKEFEQYNGIGQPYSGISLYNQPLKTFNMSYRTKVSNDVEPDYGYKIHLLYNLLAEADASTFQTLSDDVKPLEFGWSLTGMPQRAQNYRPTAHISIDSNDVPAGILRILEGVLYGTASSEPHFPTIEDVIRIFEYWSSHPIILDNGDGTWLAIDESGLYITMLDPTTFQIAGAYAVYLDADTYQIETTI